MHTVKTVVVNIISGMTDHHCPNMSHCRLVNSSDFPVDDTMRDDYIRTFCKGTHPGYNACRRYIVSRDLFLCPDFVLPDSIITLNDIFERIEKEQ